jgi:hypothetical protein
MGTTESLDGVFVRELISRAAVAQRLDPQNRQL